MSTIVKDRSLSTTQTPASTKPIKSRLLRFADLTKKVCQTAINRLSFGRLCVPSLAEKKISLIQDFKNQKLYEFPKLPANVKVIPSSIRRTCRFYSSIEGTRHFAREMISLMIDRIQVMYVDPQLYDLIKVASDIPEILKNLAKSIIELGTISAKPIFEIFSNLNIDAQAQAHLNKALEWALKDIKPENQIDDQFIEGFQDNLLRRILQANESSHQAIDQNIEIKRKECSKRVLNWLLTDDRISPKDIFQDDVEKPSDEMQIEVFQRSLQMLAEAKIEIYKNLANQIIGNDFEEELKNSLKENALIFTDTLTAQLGNILDMGSEQFTVLCDKLLKLLAFTSPT